MLFADMLATHGYACKHTQNQLPTLLGREPQSVDTAIQEHYGTQAAGAAHGPAANHLETPRAEKAKERPCLIC
jgi:hypothetical protein